MYYFNTFQNLILMGFFRKLMLSKASQYEAGIIWLGSHRDVVSLQPSKLEYGEVMTFETAQLRTLVAIVETGSFTKAAAKVNPYTTCC